MSEKRVEVFQGYCPTQDKWEKVEQTYLDVTLMGSEHNEYMRVGMARPHISFRNGNGVICFGCSPEHRDHGRITMRVRDDYGKTVYPRGTAGSSETGF